MQAIPTSADQAPASVSQLFSYPFRIFFLSMTVLTLVAIPVCLSSNTLLRSHRSSRHQTTHSLNVFRC